MLHYEVYIFVDTYNSQGWKQVEKTYQEIFSCVFTWYTEEKVVVRFEGERGQNAIYEVTLCKYLDPENELPIGLSLRFLCLTHPV